VIGTRDQLTMGTDTALPEQTQGAQKADALK